MTTPDIAEMRKEFAAAFKIANEQLAAAARVVSEKNWTVTLYAWRYGQVLNTVHGVPAGTGIEGSIPGRLMKEYCEELGFSTRPVAGGGIGGGSRVAEFRRLAARIADEDRLREVYQEYGSLSLICKGFLRGKDPGEAQESQRAADRDRRSHHGDDEPGPRGYWRFVPPQDWASYLIQQGLTRGEIGACQRLVLETVGPEESFKIWDRAGRPETGIAGLP